MRQIVIQAALNGWICQVGCQTVVFDNKKQMLDSLSDYIDKPEEVEKAFQAKALNRGSVPAEIVGRAIERNPIPQAYASEPAQCESTSLRR